MFSIFFYKFSTVFVKKKSCPLFDLPCYMYAHYYFLDRKYKPECDVYVSCVNGSAFKRLLEKRTFSYDPVVQLGRNLVHIEVRH